LATRLVNKVQQRFDVNLSVKQLFESPTIRSFASLLEGKNWNAGFQPIPVSEQTYPPLSYAQERLCFLQKLENVGASYNIPLAFSVKGDVDTTALEAALNALVERHSILRTRYTSITEKQNTRFYQEIDEQWQSKLDVDNWSGLALNENSPEVRSRVQELITRTFSLEHDPIFRVNLIQLAEVSIVVIVVHHIAADGWSMSTVLSEISDYYRQWSKTGKIEYQPLSIQYKDFAAWQKSHIDRVKAEQLGYWCEQLNSIPELHALPLDHPRATNQDFSGCQILDEIESNLTQDIQRFCQQHNITDFILLQSVFALLVARYSGENDIVIGTPIAGRNHPQTESLIGFFVNTLVLRNQIGDSQTFDDYLTCSKEMVLSAFEHQDLPFELLVEAIQPKRSLAYNPLFQLFFSYQGESEGDFKLGQLEANTYHVEQTIAKTDLALSIKQENGQLLLSWEYATQLFEESTIRQLSLGFKTLLKSLIARPEISVFEAELLSQKEYQQFERWNQTQYEISTDKPIHRLIESVVDRNEDVTAVCYQQQSLTYKELNHRANQLARYLVEEGVEVGDHVGICLERCLEIPVAILAIHKVGAAYVPIDPALPEARIKYLIEDASISVLITSELLQSKMPETKSYCIPLESIEKKLNQYDGHNLGYAISPEHGAYVIYTSGSTGMPKGVKINHRQLVHSNEARKHYYAPEHVNVCLSFPSISFDAGTAGIFWTLCDGGLLCIPEQESILDMNYLANLIEQKQVSHLIIPPTVYLNLLEMELNGQYLKAVVVGGSSLRSAVVTKHQEMRWSQNAKLVNEYGPTEVSIWSSAKSFTRESKTAPISIGKPICNTRFYVLDSNQKPVPVGVRGELYIAGDGLSEGYWNKPELTDEAFISIEHHAIKEERLYRTGDWVKFLPNGDLLFLGRADEQVKLRGLRIELGEVESQIKLDDKVKAASVVVGKGDVLSAYIVANTPLKSLSEEDSFIQALQLRLEKALPEYMVPASITLLSELPLTANGKVDKKRLPAPKTHLVEHCVKPDSELESQLLAIVTQVLDCQMGVTCNLFEKGANSLSIISIVTQVNKIIEATIAINHIFESQTIRRLANIIEGQKLSSQHNYFLPLKASGNKTPILIAPCSPGFGSYLHEFAENFEDHPVYTFQAKGLFADGEPQDSPQALAEFYLQQVPAEILEKNVWLMGHSIGCAVIAEMNRIMEQKLGYGASGLVLLDGGYLPGTPVEPYDAMLQLLSMLSENANEVMSKQADWSENLSRVFRHLKEKDELPEHADLDVFEGMFKTYCTQIEMEYHQPQKELPEVLLIETQDSRERYRKEKFPNCYQFWNERCQQFHHYLLPFGHVALVANECGSEVASLIKDYIRDKGKNYE
uniref:non-ribosomal peptide synthetase n=1 Tax=Aliikangiella sp. G2MR2-5 TaxID=2788943 RepID=UPI0018AA9214